MARLKRKKRVRRKIAGAAERPRLTVFRSAKHIYAQIIDDQQGRTLAAASTLSKEFPGARGRIERRPRPPRLVGKLLAERAKAAGISKVAFDRNGFLYHGRIKELADSCREHGLEF